MKADCRNRICLFCFPPFSASPVFSFNPSPFNFQKKKKGSSLYDLSVDKIEGVALGIVLTLWNQGFKIQLVHLKIVKTNCKTRICLLGSFPFILLLFLGKAALCKILDSGQIFLDIAESSLRVVICQKIIRVYFWHPIHCRDKNKRANTLWKQLWWWWLTSC